MMIAATWHELLHLALRGWDRVQLFDEINYHEGSVCTTLLAIATSRV